MLIHPRAMISDREAAEQIDTLPNLFPNVFSIIFATSNFAMSMVILAGPEAFLEPLGASLERSWDFWVIFGAPSELRASLAGSREERRGTSY